MSSSDPKVFRFSNALVFWLGLLYTPYKVSGLPVEAQTHWSNNTHVSGISNEIKMACRWRVLIWKYP